MANGCHFGKKIEKSSYISNGLTDRHEIWYDVAHWSSCQPLKFRIFKITKAVGRHFGQSKNRHTSATVWQITAKFGRVTQVDPFNTIDCQYFQILKTQDGGRLPFWNKTRKIVMSQQQFDLSPRNLTRWRILILCTLWLLKFWILKPQVVRQSPFWNWIDPHVSATVWPITAKFGVMTYLLKPKPLNFRNFENGT